MKIKAITKKYKGELIVEIPKIVVKKLELKDNQVVYLSNIKKIMQE